MEPTWRWFGTKDSIRLNEIRQTSPGYPLYGRMRGLAELRGVEAAVRQLTA